MSQIQKIEKKQNSNQQTINVKKLSNQFSTYSLKLQRCTTSIITFGNSQSGKSTLLDLLAGTSLTLKKDPQFGFNRFYRHLNQKFDYPPIYFQIKQNTLFLQGLTTFSNVQKMNFVKKVFIREALRKIKNVAFVNIFLVSYDNSQYMKILQEFCQFLQASKFSKNELDWLKNNTFICFNRCNENDGQKQSFLQEKIDNLIQDAKQSEIKEILIFLKQKGLQQIQERKQQSGYIFQVRDELMESDQKDSLIKLLTQIKKQQNLVKISNNLLIKQTKQIIFDTNQIAQCLQFLHDNISIFLQFIHYSKVAKHDQQPIQNKISEIKKKIFTDIKQLDQIESCLQNITPLDIIIEQVRETKDICIILQKMQKIYDSWYSNNKSMKKSSTLNQLSGHSIFLSHLLSVVKIKSEGFQQINKTIIKYNSLAKISPSKQISQNKNIDVRKQNKKKGPIDQFKESLAGCRHNFDIISKCIQKIQQKEKQEKYDFAESIFYIKMIKDLLICYRNKISQDSIIFVEEILSTYFFTQNFYEYELMLNELIDKNILPPRLASRYVQCMLGCQQYNICMKLIHYLIPRTFADHEFRALLEIKQKCLFQMDEQYKRRCNIVSEPNGYKKFEFVKPKFEISINKILEKEKDKQYVGLKQFMKGNDYKLFLQ